MPLVPKEKLKNTNGTRRTTGLFREWTLEPDHAFFTVKEADIDGCVSFKELYLSFCVDDPTEYSFAREVFGSWTHWEKLCENKQIRKLVDQCRHERDIAIESEAILKIVEEAKSGKASYQAAKFLAQKGYLAKAKQSVKKGEDYKEEAYNYDDDLKRLLGD